MYAIVLVFSIGVSKYLGSGPFYNEQGFESDRCAREWWKNLLYINNVASGEVVLTEIATNTYNLYQLYSSKTFPFSLSLNVKIVFGHFVVLSLRHAISSCRTHMCHSVRLWVSN